MIEKLVLKNWESHVNTTLDFSKGVTILSGNSDAGKSGIFRALRFVLLNTSEGDNNINYDAKETCVELHINGHIIKRIRDRSSKNEYWLDDKVFKAFGQDVPKEIKDIVGLEDINYEWQFDNRPFLICETGGYVAQTINSIVNLSLIESSLKSVDSMKRANKREIENQESQIKLLAEKINDLDWLNNAKTLYNDCYRLDTYLIKTKSQIDLLKDLKSNIKVLESNKLAISYLDNNELESFNKELETLKINTNQLSVLNNLKSQINRYSEMAKSYDIVDSKTINDALTLTKEVSTKKERLYSMRCLALDIKTCNTLINNTKTIADRSLLRLEKLVINNDKKINQQDKLSSLKIEITNYNKSINVYKNTIESLQQEYKDIAPEVCPLCNSPMSKELI